jgi:arylsulfatase A-like enzyme
MSAIVFAIDGCPAAWLGAYGNDWVGTPHLDRLAAEGVTFDRHIADRPGAHQPICAAGFGAARTLLVRANHTDTDAPDWYYAAFGEVFDARPNPDDHSPLDSLRRALPALLDRLAGEPTFLLWIETDRLLPPWDVQQDVFEAYLEDATEEDKYDTDEPPAEADDNESELEGGAEEDDTGEEEAEDEPEPVAEPEATERVAPLDDPPTGPFDRADLDAWDWLHCTFASVVTKLDAELGAMFDLLRARGFDKTTAWVVTARAGQALGEHGIVGPHRPWLHAELVHVPLIVRLPNAEQAGRRVTGFTQPPDLAPALRALLGLPHEGDAQNLLPLMRGETESARDCAVSHCEVNGVAERAIRTNEWALLVPEGDDTREPQLFAKPDDRHEVNDLYARNVERADELDEQLRRLLGRG